MTGTLIYLATALLVWAIGSRRVKAALRQSYDAGYRDALAPRRPRFLVLTTGDGSSARPFTKQAHDDHCSAFRGRECDCVAQIPQ